MRNPGLLILMLAAAPATAARLETSVRPAEVRVGDRLTLSVAVVPAETLLPFSPPANFGPFELVGVSSSATACDFVLATFDVGVATVPALTFRVRGSDGKVRELSTPEIYVPVKSVLAPGETALKDIKGELKPPPGRGWAWALAFLALGAAAFCAWRWRRTGVFPGLGAAGPPPVAPDAAALAALEGLEALMEGPSKPYYSGLVEVFRTYIEGRFGLSALDRTTAEMTPLLKELPLAAEERRALRETLETADLAKFARFESFTDERRRHLDRVRAFVLATRPGPAEGTVP